MYSMVSFNFSTPLATIKTLAPFEARIRAALLPVPWEPPVITIVWEAPSISVSKQVPKAPYPAVNRKLIFAYKSTHSVVYQD